MVVVHKVSIDLTVNSGGCLIRRKWKYITMYVDQPLVAIHGTMPVAEQSSFQSSSTYFLLNYSSYRFLISARTSMYVVPIQEWHNPMRATAGPEIEIEIAANQRMGITVTSP